MEERSILIKKIESLENKKGNLELQLKDEREPENRRQLMRSIHSIAMDIKKLRKEMEDETN